MAKAIKFNRADYMAGKVSHNEYYAQFVGRDTLYFVKSVITVAAIVNSKDEHFNDIPLAKWDRMANTLSYGLSDLAASNASMGGGSGITHSDKVCLLKAAARMIKDDPNII
jgi:hypothetical protein